MKSHRVFLSLVFLCACSNQGAMTARNQERIALDTGRRFAAALVEKRYADAHAMLTGKLQHSLTPERLEARFKEMIAHGGESVTVDGHTEFMNQWPAKKSDDIGWVYISISGDTFGEAVTLIVANVKGDPKIRDIEWGRP